MADDVKDTPKTRVAHTPGPWTCKPTEDGAYALNPSGVGWLRCSKEETWANARTIAAAPDMLQALREVAGGCYSLDSLGLRCVFCLMVGAPHDPDCTMQFVNEALAKAEGRS